MKYFLRLVRAIYFTGVKFEEPDEKAPNKTPPQQTGMAQKASSLAVKPRAKAQQRVFKV